MVRDKDSGKPIAGLEIQAAVFDEQQPDPGPGIEARTDAEGRYRLDGLAKAAGLPAVHQDRPRACPTLTRRSRSRPSRPGWSRSRSTSP